PASGVEKTLRHPAGPSRGSSSTGPPSPIAREYEFGVGTIAGVESQLACTGTLGARGAASGSAKLSDRCTQTGSPQVRRRVVQRRTSGDGPGGADLNPHRDR